MTRIFLHLIKKRQIMKFRSDLIHQILNNESNCIENTIRAIRPDKKIVIAQGYGAHAKMPVRFLAYAVPTLRLAAQMPQTAQVELYIAAKGSARANEAYYQSNMYAMAWMLQRYVDEYHSNVTKQVRILGDTGNITECAEKLIDDLMETAIGVANTDTQLGDFIAKRGGKRSLRYMVEHLLYMRDPIKTEIESIRLLMVPGMSVDFDHLIMIGGPSEKIFWRLRQEILKRYGSHEKWQSHQFFTPIGDPPPYHWYEGEPILGEILPEKVNDLFSLLTKLPGEMGKQKNLVRDYVVLLQDLARVETFHLPSKANTAVLEKGYEELKNFLATYLL